MLLRHDEYDCIPTDIKKKCIFWDFVNKLLGLKFVLKMESCTLLSYTKTMKHFWRKKKKNSSQSWDAEPGTCAQLGLLTAGSLRCVARRINTQQVQI